MTQKIENYRPNLLILITDQQRAIQHFPEGWAEKHLPALTLLRNTGVEFVQGFCNSCMCSPSRSTLFTSLYPAQHGVTDTLSFGGKYSITEPTLDPTLPNLAKMLRPHYDVHYRGKWHLSKGGMNSVHPEKSLMRAEVAQFGFDAWVAPDAGEDIALPNFGGGFAAHDELYIEQAIQFIRQYNADKAKGKHRNPFALVVSLVNPHDVLAFPKTYIAGGYNETWLNGDIGLPNTVDEKLMENWKPAAQWMLKAVLALSLGELKQPIRDGIQSLQGDPGPDLQLQYLNFYGNLMSMIDLQIGQILEEFYDRDETGKLAIPNELANDTLILRLSDHGEMGLAHGGLRQKAFNAYEETIRVPYIFSNPKFVNPTGAPIVSNQLASLIDIVPTLAGITGIDTSTMGFKGVDLSAAVKDPGLQEPIQTSILFTFDDVKSGNKNVGNTVNAADRLRCVRTADWKYVHYFDANGSYAEEYELYYIRGIIENETHPGIDPNDVMDQALKGQPYEYVNLYYAENPVVKSMPDAAKAIIEKAKTEMAQLLRERLLDIKVGNAVAIRKQLGKTPEALPTN